MTDALTSLDMSTGLRKVADRAKREPAARFHSLAHLIDEELLARAFARLRSDAAVGVDGITKEQYGQDLQSKLRDLHERLKTRRYRGSGEGPGGATGPGYSTIRHTVRRGGSDGGTRARQMPQVRRPDSDAPEADAAGAVDAKRQPAEL